MSPAKVHYRSAYSDGLLPRYAYISGGYAIVEGNGGDISAFRHSGGSALNPSSTPISTSIPKPGEANRDNKIDGLDYVG